MKKKGILIQKGEFFYADKRIAEDYVKKGLAEYAPDKREMELRKRLKNVEAKIRKVQEELRSKEKLLKELEERHKPIRNEDETEQS